jgi:hypothetical protein
MAEEIVINRGSDLDFDLLYENVAEDGTVTPTDLTGATFELYEPHAILVGKLSYAFDADRTTGIVHMTLAWDDELPSAIELSPGEHVGFRGRITIAGKRTSSEEMRFVIV